MTDLGQTVNQDMYKGVLERLREGIRRLRPIQQRAASYNIIRQSILVTTSNHFVAACAIFSRFVTLRFLFLRLQRASKGLRYSDIQTIQTAMTKQLCRILESNFQDCFKDPRKCWKRCIDAG
jgi:hypothetical protein